MRVVNNMLEGAEYIASKNTSGALVNPRFIVLHEDYGTWSGTTSWVTTQTKVKVSYHLYISKTGLVRQFVPLNRRAYHAGVSSYKGFTSLNDHSIGVCFENRNGEVLTADQPRVVEQVCKALVKAYPSITEVTDHKAIAPTRKQDLKANFDMAGFNRKVFSKDIGTLTTKTAKGDVNMREGIGTSFPVVQVITKGTKVQVLKDESGWSNVVLCDKGLHGWVSSTWLE